MLKGLVAYTNWFLYRPEKSVGEKYHLWWYNTRVWKRQKWMGVDIHKSPSDMFLYQEILYSLKPSLVIEFGTFCGGSALFFASVMRQIGNPFRVLSVDISHDLLHESVRHDRDVELLKLSSLDPLVSQRIVDLHREFPGPVFAILDSDHTKKHVLAEMEVMRPLLDAGDYMVVEDSNINGHPVLPLYGAGPYEAIEEYAAKYPHDYVHDEERENKFGWTCAPRGFLVRT